MLRQNSWTATILYPAVHLQSCTHWSLRCGKPCQFAIARLGESPGVASYLLHCACCTDTTVDYEGTPSCTFTLVRMPHNQLKHTFPYPIINFAPARPTATSPALPSKHLIHLACEPGPAGSHADRPARDVRGGCFSCCGPAHRQPIE